MAQSEGALLTLQRSFEAGHRNAKVVAILCSWGFVALALGLPSAALHFALCTAQISEDKYSSCSKRHPAEHSTTEYGWYCRQGSKGLKPSKTSQRRPSDLMPRTVGGRWPSLYASPQSYRHAFTLVLKKQCEACHMSGLHMRPRASPGMRRTVLSVTTAHESFRPETSKQALRICHSKPTMPQGCWGAG